MRTWYSGVSAGTELTAYRGTNPYLTRTWDPELPPVPGRAPDLRLPAWWLGLLRGGEVVEVADGVTDVTPGQVVHGIWGHRSDAVVPADAVRGRLDGVDPVAGCFARVGAIALNAVLAADARIGDRVAVFGQGVIGLLATRLPTLAGAEAVAVDVNPRRLETATAMGAVATVDAGVDGGAGAAVRALPGGGVDAAIELSGSDRALHEATRAVVVDGVVVASGFYQGGAANLRLGEEFHHNRVRIVASQIGGTPVALGARWNQGRLVSAFMRPGAHRPRRRAVPGDRRRRRGGRRGRVRAPRRGRPRHPPGRAAFRRRAATAVTTTARAGVDDGLPDPSPRFPADRSGVAVLGCGTIAHSAHLPAYAAYGVGVTGCGAAPRPRRRRCGSGSRSCAGSTPQPRTCSPTRRSASSTSRHRPRTGCAGSRPPWRPASTSSRRSRSPWTPPTSPPPACWRRPDAAGVHVAVNHNGRWAPPWRLTTLLLRRRAIGEVVGVTHLHDKPLPPLTGTPFDGVDHMLLTDYLLHWIDITRCWLAEGAGGGAGDVVAVRAADSRVPGQPATARNPWSATVDLTCRGGATATLRIPGHVTAHRPSCPFWVHGTEGTLRGSVLLDSDRLSLDRGSGSTDLPLTGAWFVDGFAGAMGELMCAVAEGREPENSAADAAGSVRLVLAARESARRGGAPVAVADGDPS